MAKLSWARLRESGAASAAPALERAGATGEEDEVEESETTPVAEATFCSVCGLAECDAEGVERMAEAKLNTKQRKALDKSDFAIPEKAPGPGSYPIPDPGHAQSALSRVKTNGTPAEQSQVRRAVQKKFPKMKLQESDLLLARLDLLEDEMGVFRQLREAKHASMTPTFSTLTRVKTQAGQEGYAVVLIREGKGNSEHDQWYTAESIEEMCESGICEGMQAYGDHPDAEEEELRPERSVKELVGTYHDVKFAESDGPPRAEAIFVPLTLDENHPRYGWVVTLAEAATRSTSQQPICGISLYGLSAGDDCERPDGSFGRMVSMIRPNSGDIVTSAGAGGGFVRQLMESARALRNRSRKELPPMKAMAYQTAVREAAKRVREAASDEDRTTALAELQKLEAESIDNAPDNVQALREAAPGLVQEIETAVKAEVRESDGDLKQENEELKSKLREAQTTLGKFTDVIHITDALREAGVEDPTELAHFAGKARERGLRESADIKSMVEAERAYSERQQEALLAKLKESMPSFDDIEIEGAIARVPTAALPSDGGVVMLRESGLPTKDAE